MDYLGVFCSFKLIAVNGYCGNERGRGGGVAVVQELWAIVISTNGTYRFNHIDININ